MSDFNPADRIRRMVTAIKSEANEKSEQIMENGRQQFKIEKNKIINQQKEKIFQEYKSKLDQYSVKMKIERSAKINEARLKKMNARYELMQNLRNDLRKRIEESIKDKNAYKALLRSLIVEGLIKLMEKEVELRCMKNDVALVESILEEASQEFTAIIKRECARDLVTKIVINTEDPLEVTHKDSIGGIILSCLFGKIVCNNTLESRINLCLQESLPHIREGLFPDLKAPEKKEVVVKPVHGHH